MNKTARKVMTYKSYEISKTNSQVLHFGINKISFIVNFRVYKI